LVLSHHAPHEFGRTIFFDRKAGMGDTHIAGVSLGGVLVIAGLVLAILLSHWWVGLIIILVGLVFFGGFAKGKWY
jgi:hypothetical protein